MSPVAVVFRWRSPPSLLLHQPLRSKSSQLLLRRPRILSRTTTVCSWDSALKHNRVKTIVPVVQANLTQSTALPDSEIVFSESFQLKRFQPVEGKVSVRLDPTAGGEAAKWKLTIGCNLEGKWMLHWGVTYRSDSGSEWDQPPTEMRPPGSVPIKDYAIETPMKKSSSALQGEVLYEVQIDLDKSSSIAAIHFVLKEEETGAWFQQKGRDFRIPLMGYHGEADTVPGGKQGYSMWSGAFNQLSTLLLKAEGSHITDQQAVGNFKDAAQQLGSIRDIYEEFPIVKEEAAQNSLTITVRKTNEKDEKHVLVETDIPGDVTIHWGVCREDKSKWEIPSTPLPPATTVFRGKALRTLLQPKTDGLGSWGLFPVEKQFSGLLFVLKLSEYVWLNNMGTDFYVPLTSMSSLPTQNNEDQVSYEQIEHARPENVTDAGHRDSVSNDKAKVEVVEGDESSVLGKSKSIGQSEVVNHTGYTDEIISEIRSLVSDISSEKSRRTKSKETQENILQEIEKLAAEAYSIFRSSAVGFTEESVSDSEKKPSVKVSSGTGSGYEILCQGFNWESHKSGKWYIELGQKAKELASFGFTIVWLPPPTESVSPEGYMPKDLYNLNSRYGNMDQLKDLVATFREVGIKVLGDVVLNHRCAHYQNSNGIWNIFGGRLNWDERAIVADDPHFQGRGNKSSGDSFHAAPNIDHSQDFVRKDLKEWLHWLRREVGYDGWRLDFVRGFWGGYVKDYLEATEPYFAVGEYWDSLNYTYGVMDHNQDAHRQRIIDWINATNGTAGAFDVTTKGILHSALEKCEYWRLSDEKGKPPGVVGWWPSRAVTFIENHDTGSTQGHWRFPSGKEMQGYAYILTHPGTPAVFYDHIFSHYQEEIRRLIALRNRKKLHCRSTVKITKAERDVYAAEIDEKVAVKIGPGHYEPPSNSGNWVVATEGSEYKVWETQ